MIPQSGGNYTYLHEAFGPLPAFLYVWMFVMVGMPGSRAVVALSFANYVTQPFFPDGSKPPEAAVKMIGILLIGEWCFGKGLSGSGSLSFTSASLLSVSHYTLLNTALDIAGILLSGDFVLTRLGCMRLYPF